MGLEVHISLFDPEVAKRKGKPAEVAFSFLAMTAQQRSAGLKYLKLIVGKLEQHERDHPEVDMPITKYGSGDILPEPGDNQKTAAANWTPADEAELREEIRDEPKESAES